MEPSLVALYKMDSENVPILDQGPRGQADECSRKGQRGNGGRFQDLSYFESKNEGSERIYGLI